MSLVERLARRSRAHLAETFADDELPEIAHEMAEARWYINAIADELEHAPVCNEFLADWLRSECEPTPRKRLP